MSCLLSSLQIYEEKKLRSSHRQDGHFHPPARENVSSFSFSSAPSAAAGAFSSSPSKEGQEEREAGEDGEEMRQILQEMERLVTRRSRLSTEVGEVRGKEDTKRLKGQKEREREELGWTFSRSTHAGRIS